MRSNLPAERLLKAIRALDVYSDPQWHEYVSYFAGADALRDWRPKQPQPSGGELGQRIVRGIGVQPAEPDLNLSPKIRRWQDLARPEVRQGLTLGIVSGAYDLLHLGHLRGMHEARQRLGNGPRAKLCALTLSDRHIQEKKGPGRPILDINERLAMLCALRDVDYVVPLDEPDGLAALEALRPDYFFKSQADLEQEIVRRENDVVCGHGRWMVLSASHEERRISTTFVVEIVRQRSATSHGN